MKYYEVKMNDRGTVAVDDTILVKGVPAAAGSRMLEGYQPLFSAEAVTRLENSGYSISGKTCVGEFGLDLVGEFGCGAEKQETLRGAAAELVASGAVKAALAVDMNGAPRRAAALSGAVFLKPTYGTVSRYGVISCAASGEQVGVFAGDADGVAEILRVIAGHDEKDGTSLPAPRYDISADLDIAGKRVAVVRELLEKADEATKRRLSAFAEKLSAAGAAVTEVSADIFLPANTAWQILMCAETCNNISRYDGVKFGHRSENYRNIDELYINSRTEGFGFLTKAVILYGSDVLSKSRYADCYDKSLRVRRAAAEQMKALLEKADALLMPACGAVSYGPYDIREAFEKVYGESVFTAMANLTGIPALVGGGVQLMGRAFGESLLLSLLKSTEGKGV